MSLEEKFKKAAENIKNLKSSPPNDDLLELYALYKQSNVGDVNIECPGKLDLKGKAKWNAWSCKKGMSQQEAKEKYVDKAEQLMNSIGLK